MIFQKFQPQHVIMTRIPFKPAFLPLALNFVEGGAKGFGYGDFETRCLMLASDELFSFYAKHAAAGSAVEIEMEDQSYRLLVNISFALANPDMRAFNLTWQVNPESAESLETLGPMIAARTLTGLRPDFGSDDRVVLRLIQEREYPPALHVALPPSGSALTLRIAEPSREDIHHFASMATTQHPPFLPPFLERPGMAADMLAAGHLHALCCWSGEWIIGGVLWKPLTESCQELFGPFVFCPDLEENAISMLLDEVMIRLSRSNSRGLVRRQGPLHDYERFFDFSDEVRLTGQNGETSLTTYYYRQLQEESGSTIYCSGKLSEFLATQYKRLCLPRQLLKSSGLHPSLRDTSVFAVEMEHARSLAVIRLLSDGKDLAANLAAHVELLSAEGIVNFLVEINTSQAEDNAFAGTLEDAGFMPIELIPDAVTGDLVIYHYCTSSLQP
jgi:hypothetical protein